MPYIGRSMSVNAKSAHNRGLLPISAIKRKELDSFGFNYSVSFFKWLCKKHYILPREYHHTSAAKRITPFYSPDNIKFFAERANLVLLYRIYRGKITKEEAVESLGLKYYKIECVKSIIGIIGKGSVVCCVVYYKGGYFLTKKKRFWEKFTPPEKYRVIDEYKKGDSQWKNPNRKATEKHIFLFVSKHFQE